MVTKKSVVKVGTTGGAYHNPSCGFSMRPWLLMENPDAKCGFRGDVVVAALSTNNEA